MNEQLAMKSNGVDSFAVIYENYYAKIYHTCYQYAKNREDALDWTQDIMLKISESLSGFAGRSSLSTWIFSITRNHCISKLERRNRFHFSDISVASALAADLPNHDEFEDRLQKEARELVLGEYLARLPESDRRFLELKYFGNYSVRDLQDEFKLSASAVKMRLQRARQKAGQVFTARPAA